MRDLLAGRQAELHRAVNERLDSVTHHLNQSMTTTRQHTVESLQKLNERLAVIDNAQRNIADLASQMTSLQSVLANKQQRGAFGQSRMELIVQDGLPKDCYQFQFTLSNKCRPDCAVFLPDRRPLTIDAKFPLEAINACMSGCSNCSSIWAKRTRTCGKFSCRRKRSSGGALAFARSSSMARTTRPMRWLSQLRCHAACKPASNCKVSSGAYPLTPALIPVRR